MNIRRQRVSAPDDDQITLRRFIRLRLQRPAHNGIPSVAFGGGAKSPLQTRRSQFIEKCIACVTLHHSHRSGIRGRQYGLSAILADDFTPTSGNASHSFIPENFTELARSFGAGAKQRRCQA